MISLYSCIYFVEEKYEVNTLKLKRNEDDLTNTLGGNLEVVWFEEL